MPRDAVMRLVTRLENQRTLTRMAAIEGSNGGGAGKGGAVVLNMPDSIL